MVPDLAQAVSVTAGSINPSFTVNEKKHGETCPVPENCRFKKDVSLVRETSFLFG